MMMTHAVFVPWGKGRTVQKTRENRESPNKVFEPEAFVLCICAITAAHRRSNIPNSKQHTAKKRH